MLKALRTFFEQQLAPAGAGDPQQLLRVASAALWLEMGRADGRILPTEHAAVLEAVRAKFDVDESEARALLESAEAAAARATDDFEFTSLINSHFTPEQKEQVIEHLWQVAYADGELSAYEEHFVRRIAELLYVDHGAYIAAKLRAERGAGT